MKIAVLLALLLIVPAASADVLLVNVDDAITSAHYEMVKDALSVAHERGMQAIILQLHTPGGTVADTIKIAEEIGKSDVPVIGYVAPEGAYAWSAGTLLLVSTDVAAMSSHTVIGSAQPVSIGISGSKPIEDSKTINALVALFSEKARMHGRNQSAVESFVRDNLNMNEKQALQSGVIEIVAENPEQLLAKIDGMQVKGKTLATAGDSIIIYDSGLRISFLSFVTNPILSSIMLLVGIYSLIFGLHSPGMGAEIAGLILIIMAIIGLGFNINLAAVALIVLGVALLVSELTSHGFGALGVGGIISLVAGSILLAPVSYPEFLIASQAANVMLASVLLPSIIVGAFFGLAIYKVAKIRRKKPLFGDIKGESAMAVDSIGPKKTGFVRYRGELWEARSCEKIEKGQWVVIEGKRASTLEVCLKKDNKKGEK